MKKILMAMILMPMMTLAVKAGSIADGLDWTGSSWTTGGTPSVMGENVDWFYSTDDFCSDGDCVVSGAGGAGYAPSWLKTTIQGPCKISFQYKFQTYGGSFVLTDNSKFLINKSCVCTGRSEPWTFAEFELGGGPHELQFQYTHPGQGFVGAFNGVHLDEFRVEYDSPRATTWYVNGTSGSDSYSGTSASSAKKTIQAAIDAATDGDKILVAEGTYAPIRSWGKRIVIKSVSGPRKSIIDGEGTQRCAKLLESDGWDWDVAVEDIPCNSTLDGFTLTNGYAENNVGVEGGVVKNCIITGNHGWDDSAGGGFARFYNCLIYGNRTDNLGGRPSGSGIRMSCAYNCTIVNNMSCGGGGAVSHRSKLCNCIVAENYDGNGRLDNIYEAVDDKTTLISCCVDMPMFVDAESGDYRLAAGSPCIDAGDNAYVTSETDLDGNARIVNGKVDIGCYEYGTETSLNNGLIAWYKFDGNANDLSGNGNNGVVHGATLATDRFGNANGAYSFDGDDWIEVANSVSLSNVRQRMSFSAWVNLAGNPIDEAWPMICKSTGSDGYSVFVCRDKIQLYWGGERNDIMANQMSGGFQTGKWYHVVCSVSEDSVVGYVDGVEVGRVAVAGENLVRDVGLLIGKDPPERTEYFTGAMDDLRIYNRALSAAEVKALYEGEGGSSAGGVQLWENGPFWAECNVGATIPEDPGCYFWWGDTVGYKRDSADNGWVSVKDGSSYAFNVCPTTDKDNAQLQSAGYIDATGNLVAAHDAAAVHLGGSWRMPTDAEFSALISNCTTMWTTRNGVSGRLVTGKGAYSSKSIFLPAAGGGAGDGLFERGMDGCYWSSTPFSDTYDYANGLAWGLSINSSYSYRVNYGRFTARSVRPVRGFVSNCSVTFDTNGGLCSTLSKQYTKGAAVGTLPTATREGYEFLGWFTAAVGGTQVTAETVVTEDVTYYAQWTPLEYDISYLYLKGAENPNPATYTIEDELTFLALSDVLGWTFAEWSLDGISLGSTGDKTVSAHWTPVTYGISYTGVKGGANPNPMSYTIEDAITFTALSDVTGYRFTGWSPRGIEAGTTGDKTIAAQYVPIRYAIAYVNTMGAANPNPTSYTIEDVVTFAALPDVEGWRFIGWSFAGISRGNTGDVTVSANWEAIAPSVIPDEEDPMDAGVANTYDGIIKDADGLPVGYISIKTAKASGEDEVKTSKVTATIQMTGEAKKVTVKGDVIVSEAALVQPAPGGRVLDLMFTRNSIFGTFDGYEIEGVRNILASTAKGDKGLEAKQRTEAICNRLKGNYVMAYGDDNGWNGLSVSVAAKGKVKVSGKLADGTSVATSTQLIVGEDYSCVPVIYTKKEASLSFSIYFSNDGAELSVFGYYDAVISRVTALGGERMFYIDGDLYGLFDVAGYKLVGDFLPWEAPVAPEGTKWIVANGAKAGQIKMDKDGEVYDKKESDNPSGLKLTFTAKTGLFKGAFKVYAIDAKGKLKSFSATVNGIVVDGVGYGTATIKKVGSVPIAID